MSLLTFPSLNEKRPFKILFPLVIFAWLMLGNAQLAHSQDSRDLSADMPNVDAPAVVDPIELNSETQLKDTLQEIVTLDYKDVEIATILRSLSQTYDLNLVTSPELKGKVTVSLKDVTVQEALEVILSSGGYNYSKKGNIIYVVSSSEDVQLASEPLILKYMKAGEAANLLKKVLSPKGDIKVDEMSNIILITDYPSSIDKVKELLKTVDAPPLQVLIEVKIVDITSQDLRNLGVTWEMDYNPGSGLFGRRTETDERITSTGSYAGPSSSLSTGQIRLDTFSIKDFSASATIDALVQDRKANLLASPSIAVMNNREARIIIGEKVPYKERTQSTTGTTETTKFIDVGTTLRVTPSINPDGYITMMIHPEVSSVTTLLDAGPRITTREADTMVRVKEGETLVIGGLIKQEDSQTHSETPVLGKIPILGFLFGNKSKDQLQTELAVFITPKILRSHEEMAIEKRTRYDEEAAVSVMSSGSLNAQSLMMAKAVNLENSTGLESRRKEDWQRLNQSLSIFSTIYTQFPDGPLAPEAAYRAAVIYFRDFDELFEAKELCGKIISDYPKSPYAAKAKSLFKRINLILEAQAQRKVQKAKDQEDQQDVLTEPATNALP